MKRIPCGNENQCVEKYHTSIELEKNLDTCISMTN